MVYTATLMTENAFYPVFLAAVLALVVVARPADAREHGLLLGACLRRVPDACAGDRARARRS